MKKCSMISKEVIFSYIKSMRLYLFFLSGMAGCLGIVYSRAPMSIGRIFSILIIVFLGWGVNQVINDLLGLKEDRINAPHRPLVTGELPIKAALTFSIFLFTLGGVVSYMLNSQALILYLLTFILNIIYEYSKRIPLVGNILFGVLLIPCIYYGAMCMNGKGLEILLDKKLIFIAMAIFLMNITVAFFTYYKDFVGDKFTGVKTIIVQLSPDKAKYFNFFVSAFPFTIVLFLISSPDWKGLINPYFFIFVFLSFLILQYTAFLFFKNPQGSQTYYSLKWNFRGAVLFKTSLIALNNPLMAAVLYIVNFILIGFLFSLHKDHLA